jgi:acyl transferase domain-containing protein
MPMTRIARSNTSVFVGAFMQEHDALLTKDPELPAKYAATGIGSAMLANRISWFYDLRGPSLALNTACSSSLIALHLACQSVLTGEASMSLIGGCNLICDPTVMAYLSDFDFLGADGISYAFDDRANGYARGEGVGCVVVKRLSQALEDGDPIRAVIRATAINHDGKTPVITQPSVQAQEALIRSAYEAAGLGTKATGYFEAHATGTQAGDPVEASAISAVFGDNQPPIVVGALKTNIGHLEGASGVAGLIKTILILEKGLIPPNIWYNKPNPRVVPFISNFQVRTMPL